MKGPWENRVGIVLHNPDQFKWAYKPADSSLYGGQPRIDWLACDRLGRFWMVEVKQVGPDRRSLNVMSEVSPGQREALDAVASSDVGIALLVIGQGNTLYVFDWRMVQWRLTQDVGTHANGDPKILHRLPLSSAPIQIQWTGKKHWQSDLDLYAPVVALRQEQPSQTTTPTIIVPGRSRNSIRLLPSTSKHEGYTHMLP